MLPFSVGCASESSVAVVENRVKNSKNEPNSMSEGRKENRTKSLPLILLQLPRPNFYAGLHRIAKGFKVLTNLFSVYTNDSEEEEEMEIGYPTDVRHVGHIGWEGFNNLDGIKNW